MKLNVREWGDGDRVAILVHGITSDSGAWCRVAPVLAGRGYRVQAPDLRGHGLSPRGRYSPGEWADDLVDSVPLGADLAIGHSLGGIALALAMDRLCPKRAVYEDPAWTINPDTQPARIAYYERQKTATAADIRREFPRWSEEDVAAKIEALQLWDPATVGGLLTGKGQDHAPISPVVHSLVMLADPSELVPPGQAARLRQAGFDVQVVPGTGHSIHRDDLDGFMHALDEFLVRTIPDQLGGATAEPADVRALRNP